MTQPTATVQALLLDIEGTTTPVDFVFGVLFPFARDRVADFLAAHGEEAEVQADLTLLRQEYEADQSQSADVPKWKGEGPTAAVPYIHHLITIDRKSTGLKALQGKLWEQGYADGGLRSQLFPDVKSAFERWTEAGKSLYIFSSGSIQAQKLLFTHTEVGDLTPFIRGYFDTTTGPKKSPKSYHRIADAIGHPPEVILFISDVVAELEAAQAAGMQVRLSIRPGNAPQEDTENFTIIHNFDEIA